jgi:hypothetical protein
MDVQPTPGLSNSVHHVFVARAVTRIGEPVDAFESERVDWVPLSDVLRLTERGDVVSGTTLATLLYVLARSADAPAHGGSDGRVSPGTRDS